MGKLITYAFVSLNGYFKGANEDISWAKKGSNEESEFVSNNLKSENILLFGRVTYEMLARYWPTSDAIKNDPEVAEGMNRVEKIVFSKTLTKATWNNTKVVNDDPIEEVKRLKLLDKNLTLLGSGSVLSQFAQAALIDEMQILIQPVVLEEGTPLLKGVKHRIDMNLINTKTFKSVVLHTYEPVKR